MKQTQQKSNLLQQKEKKKGLRGNAAALWPRFITTTEKPGEGRSELNSLGISELKWPGMGEFNSEDHFIYYCGQESLRRNGVAIIVKKKSPSCSTWMQSQK